MFKNINIFIFKAAYKVAEETPNSCMMICVNFSKKGICFLKHLRVEVKWPDKSTTSYAMLDFESDKENL